MDAPRVKSLSIAPDGAAFVESRSPEWRSWFFTALGVFCFSFTFPMTRLSLRAFDPIFVALVRGAGAGMAALVYLVLSRSRIPERSQLLRLGCAAIGMVVLFPILVSMALKFVPATHASVLGSILPLVTAVFGVIRGHERVSRRFWFFAFLGSVLIGLFSAYRSGFHSIEQADILLVAAFIACSYGYAEGGLLAREMGGWLVICWALVTVLPLELFGLFAFLSGRSSNRVSTCRGMGGVGVPYCGEPIHRVFLLLQGSRTRRNCEDEPGAIALAVPGNLRRALDAGRKNRGLHHCWDGRDYSDRGGRKKRAGESANAERRTPNAER